MATFDFLANALATVLIVGLALVPFANLAVGTIIGGAAGGAAGFFIGGLLAVLVTAIEVILLQRPRESIEATRQFVFVSAPRATSRATLNLATRRRDRQAAARSRIAWSRKQPASKQEQAA